LSYSHRHADYTTVLGFEFEHYPGVGRATAEGSAV